MDHHGLSGEDGDDERAPASNGQCLDRRHVEDGLTGLRRKVLAAVA